MHTVTITIHTPRRDNPMLDSARTAAHIRDEIANFCEDLRDANRKWPIIEVSDATRSR